MTTKQSAGLIKAGNLMQSCVAVCPVNTQPKCNTAVKDFEEKKELSYCSVYLLRRGRVRIGFCPIYLLQRRGIRIGFCSVFITGRTNPDRFLFCVSITERTNQDRFLFCVSITERTNRSGTGVRVI